MSKEEDKFEAYRGESSSIAYDHLKGVAGSQMSHGADVDSKASAMFALATAMVGLGIPLILTRLSSGQLLPYSEVLVVLLLVAAAFYLVAFGLFFFLYWIQKYQDLTNPEQIKRIIKCTEAEAYVSLYWGIEKVHENNRKINKRKVTLFKCLLSVVGIQTLIVIFCSLWIAWASFPIV